MAKKVILSLVFISLCLVLSVFISGCQSLNSSQSTVDGNVDSTKKAQAISLVRQLGHPAQIALAGLGLNPAGLKALKAENANCKVWGDQLSGFLSKGEVKQKVVNIDEVKIALSAVELITTGQFLMDVPKLVLGVGSNVVEFPLDLYKDAEKLKKLPKAGNKAILQSLSTQLKQDINAFGNSQRKCRLSIVNYVKDKVGFVERQCTPTISSPALDRLRDLAVPNLALNSAGDVVNNDTAWTAAQIFALIHGWTIPDNTRIALAKALAENPDLWPLIDNGIDVLLQRENADSVIAFLGKVKEANSTCGPKEETMLTKLP